MSVENEPHDGRHFDCDPCFKVKLASIQFQGIDAGQRRFTDKTRSNDMDAYKSLRRQGYQPNHVFGSAEVAAQAESKFEVEHSVVMAPSIRKEMAARVDEAKSVLA